LREDQWIRGDETGVMLNTGAGIKYPDSVRADPPRLAPGDEL
jgi:threonine synthase